MWLVKVGNSEHAVSHAGVNEYRGVHRCYATSGWIMTLGDHASKKHDFKERAGLWFQWVSLEFTAAFLTCLHHFHNCCGRNWLLNVNRLRTWRDTLGVNGTRVAGSGPQRLSWATALMCDRKHFYIYTHCCIQTRKRRALCSFIRQQTAVFKAVKP